MLLLVMCAGVTANLSAQTAGTGSSQEKPTEALLVTIKALDTQLFDAYNHCDIPALGAL